ncbi:hypothetical protein [Sutcliffiella halmapala]|uniref:hypothetical protein n=1 Tax=Sutcliffiella halmapala TaxID=79882 RepID=UPI00099523D8|nr:hypothetical protein [Sutcliffiella halmapala]
MKHAILVLVVCSFFVSGCTAEPRTNQREDINGTRLIGTHGDTGFYKRDLDSEDYNTNQNPNFLDLTENRLDYGDDQDKFAEVITMNSDLQPGRVYITGDTARVTAYHDGTLSKEEKSKLKKHLAKKFVDVTPRYRVKLTIKER